MNRSLHEKEGFLKGNRQRWLIIFLICMFIILGLDATGKVERVDSYLTFLTFLSGAFILGYSGTETMKLFSVSSVSQNNNSKIQEDINKTSTNTNININETLTHNAKEEDYVV